MLSHYTATLLLSIASMIGVVEATENCPAGTVPTLEGISVVVTTTDNNIIISGVPEWGACVPGR